MISRQLRVYFLSILRKSYLEESEVNFRRQKLFFSKASDASFWVHRMCCVHFQSTLCMWKMFLNVQAIFWYNLNYHMTLRNDFATAESIFSIFIHFFPWSTALQNWAVTPWICVLWPWNLFFWTLWQNLHLIQLVWRRYMDRKAKVTWGC